MRQIKEQVANSKKKAIKLSGLFVLCFLTFDLAASLATAEDIIYPADSGVINVKDYGAKGDGVTDDTLAIQTAISQNLTEISNDHIIYFPNGTYLVSNRLTP